MRKRLYSTYILTNFDNTVFYVGVTNNLARRMREHKGKRNPLSFTARYNVDRLVYYANSKYVLNAIALEKRIKAGSRAKKKALVEQENPRYKDLSAGWE